MAERSHHRATPGSLSSGCYSVLRPSCLQGTWAHLHWMCSCLWSSSSKQKKTYFKNTGKTSLQFIISNNVCATFTKKTSSQSVASHLQFCCHRYSTWGPCNLAQAVQGSPRCGWRNPVSVQLMALSPCQLDDDNEHSEAEIIFFLSFLQQTSIYKSFYEFRCALKQSCDSI